MRQLDEQSRSFRLLRSHPDAPPQGLAQFRLPHPPEAKSVRGRHPPCYKRQGDQRIVRRLAAAIIVTGLLVSSQPAWPQVGSATLSTAGLYLIPSFKISESFDDN